MLQFSPNLTQHTRLACQNFGFQQSSRSRTCSHLGTACKEKEKNGYMRDNSIKETKMLGKLPSKCVVV